MLVLSRRSSERIIIGNSIQITVLETRDTEVVLAIEAPNENRIHRAEKPRECGGRKDDQEVSGGSHSVKCAVTISVTTERQTLVEWLLIPTTTH
jgi:carbon storage regulator CsrA